MKLNSFAGMVQDLSNGVVDFTVDGECSNCGNCCVNVLPVSEAELNAIRSYVRKHNVKEEKIWMPTALPIINTLCPFRNEKERKCNIYPVRPEICRKFRCDASKGQPGQSLVSGGKRVVFMREEFYGQRKG